MAGPIGRFRELHWQAPMAGSAGRLRWAGSVGWLLSAGSVGRLRRQAPLAGSVGRLLSAGSVGRLRRQAPLAVSAGSSVGGGAIADLLFVHLLNNPTNEQMNRFVLLASAAIHLFIC